MRCTLPVTLLCVGLCAGGVVGQTPKTEHLADATAPISSSPAPSACTTPSSLLKKPLDRDGMLSRIFSLSRFRS
jgi:hypothetical protein